MDVTILLYILAVLMVLAGIAGTILPALPGIPLIFAGMLLGAWAGGFEYIGPTTVAILAAITLFSFVIDLWATAVGAKRVGASRPALVGAVLGTVVGLFFGLIGLFAGPFVGALLGELWSRRSVAPDSLGQATKVGLGTWLGIALGTALKLMLVFAMLGIFLLAWIT